MSYIILIFVSIGLLLPVVFWRYIICEISEYRLSRYQFLIGIGAGVLTTLPLAFHDVFFLSEIINSILFSLTYSGSFYEYVQYFLKFFLLFGVLGCFLAFFRYIFYKNISHFGKQNWFFLGLIFIVCSLATISIIFLGSSVTDLEVQAQSFVFSGIGGIIGYYLTVALLEEGWKWQICNSTFFDSRKESYGYIISSAIIIALGFSFLENILYTISYYNLHGIDGGMISLVFVRSLFSSSLHILCSCIIALGFFAIMYGYKSYSSYFLLCLIGVCAHMLFDVSITLDFFLGTIIILLALYLFLGNLIFSKK